MLSFVEEITLLLLDDTQGRFVDLPLSASDVVVAGAALMDLALADRIDSDLERLTVVDTKPTGDDILDDALARLAQPGQELSVSAAVEGLAAYAEGYKEKALKRLVAHKIPREEKGRFLWGFPTRPHTATDGNQPGGGNARLRPPPATRQRPAPPAG